MAKKETKRLTIVVDPEVYRKLNESGYNSNKLINQLLKNYLEKNQK